MLRIPLVLACFSLAALLSGCSSGAMNGGNGGGTQQVIVTVTPGAPTVSVFATQQFMANVTGSSNQNVTWQVNGVAGGNQATGFISSGGLYVAPGGVPTKSDGSGGSVPTTVRVTALSQANATASGFATVTIAATTNQEVQNGAVKLGTSGGNASDVSGNKCCGGTLGALITRSGTQYVLSANHILAKSDFAHVGDAVTQPGIIDSPSPCTTMGTKTVANLSEFSNLQTGPLPKVDAAIAQVVPGQVDASGNIFLLGATQTNGVPDSGAPHAGSGTAASVGMNVAKSGRTTGLTCSTIFATNVLTSVDYTQNCDGTGIKFTASFTNQVDIAGGSFSAEGDSGSLIVSQSAADPVALLFAGSDMDTLGNPVSDVLNAFVGAGNAKPTFVGGAQHAVIGCTLPTKLAAVAQTLAATLPAVEALQRATTARDAHLPEFMAQPQMQAVGVGASYDDPSEPAVLLFVTAGQARTTSLPAQVDGVRTRIVEAPLFEKHGAVSASESTELEKTATAPQLVYAISEAEMARAKVVQTVRVSEWMSKPGVQGVGVGSSADSPGDAALVVFLIRGVPHDAIPPLIEGLRTRVRESNRFRAGFGDARAHRTCHAPRAGAPKAGDVSAQTNR